MKFIITYWFLLGLLALSIIVTVAGQFADGLAEVTQVERFQYRTRTLLVMDSSLTVIRNVSHNLLYDLEKRSDSLIKLGGGVKDIISGNSFISGQIDTVIFFGHGVDDYACDLPFSIMDSTMKIVLYTCSTDSISPKYYDRIVDGNRDMDTTNPMFVAFSIITGLGRYDTIFLFSWTTIMVGLLAYHKEGKKKLVIGICYAILLILLLNGLELGKYFYISALST